MSGQIFIKVHNTKFHGNPPSGSLADVRTNMMQVIGAFRDHANAPKNIKRFIKHDINGLWAYSQRKMFWNEIIFEAESTCSDPFHCQGVRSCRVCN